MIVATLVVVEVDDVVVADAAAITPQAIRLADSLGGCCRGCPCLGG